MRPSKPKRTYNCTQNELYLICRIGWRNCREHLSEFAAYKTFYTPAYIANALRAVAAAMALPDEQRTNAASKLLHTQLRQAGDECISKWRVLQSYIRSSFPPEFTKGKIKAAGKYPYRLALNHNWARMWQMMHEGSKFIEKNTAALASGGMPAAFPAEFGNAVAAFNPLYLSYKGLQQRNCEATMVRITMNNTIYTLLQQMFLDGQIIFQKNPQKYRRFVFSEVKKLVTVGNRSGIPAFSLVVESVPAAAPRNPLRKIQKALLQKAGSYLSLF